MAGVTHVRRLPAAGGALLIVLLAAMIRAGSSGAALPIDAGLTGDPSCDAANFRGSSAGPGPYRQEFVPGSPGLNVVALCLENPGDETEVHVAIRRGGAAAPGDFVASSKATVAGGTFSYVWFDFGEVPFTPPGQRFVLEFGDSSVRWRSLCGAVAGDCTTVDPDLYPPGVSSRADLADFGFRTLPATPAGMPVGIADQALRDDPPCNPTQFRGFGSSAGPIYQEFVPSAGGLDAIDLCLQTLDANQPVTVNIRAGTSLAPGIVLGRATITVASPGFQWVRVDLAGALPTAPGQTFVIELPESTRIQWRSTCPGIGASCPAWIDPDLYPAGSAPDGRDYGFRTLPGVPEMRRLGLLAHD